MKPPFFCSILLIVGAIPFLDNILGLSDIRLKKESTLSSFIKPNSEYKDKEIRNQILKELKVGATRMQMIEFINKNFVNIKFTVSTSTDSDALYKTKEPHILIRAVLIRNMGGGESCEIYLMLDDQERLKDVIVKSERSYL
jgi:hypothetical protein